MQRPNDQPSMHHEGPVGQILGPNKHERMNKERRDRNSEREGRGRGWGGGGGGGWIQRAVKRD